MPWAGAAFGGFGAALTALRTGFEGFRAAFWGAGETLFFREGVAGMGDSSINGGLTLPGMPGPLRC
jgi:hypothetical protein